MQSRFERGSEKWDEKALATTASDKGSNHANGYYEQWMLEAALLVCVCVWIYLLRVARERIGLLSRGHTPPTDH